MTSTPSRPMGKFVGQFAEFLRHMRARWFLYVPIFAVWGFAYTRLFVDPTPRVPVLFNWTPSLPYSVAVMQLRTRTTCSAATTSSLRSPGRRAPTIRGSSGSRSSRSCAGCPATR
jgi:hypothetical protein